MNGIGVISGVALECRDPLALAQFYSTATGYPKVNEVTGGGLNASAGVATNATSNAVYVSNGSKILTLPDHVEVFPKNHDFQMVKLGNYINLPYHGTDRPILWFDDVAPGRYTLEGFLAAAQASRNDPETWRKKAWWLQISEPKPRSEGSFGEAPNLHICARHIIEEGVDIGDGHRHEVFFMLAKCLSNWREVDHDEALDMLYSVNEEMSEPIPRSEIRRILSNAERGRYTSTGCDSAVVLPYAHPDCPIAYPRR